MPKITKRLDESKQVKVIQAKTTDKSKDNISQYKWWKAQNDNELCNQLIATAGYLQKIQQYRIKQASIYARIYSGRPLINYALNTRFMDTAKQLPTDRPTMNVVQSCIDTLTSRVTQSRPSPIFLTDGGDYKEQKLSKQLNQFVGGELYRNRGYELGAASLRDAGAFGDGYIKVFEKDDRVCLERTLTTELFSDANDSWYGAPRSKIQVKICDRDVLEALFPKAKLNIEKASKAFVDGSSESSDTVSDQIMLVEGWRLPSKKGAKDGRHSIVCSEGIIEDGLWERETFPFVHIGYEPNPVGIYSRGLCEILLGTQIEINKLLITISNAINLVGVPRVFINEMSRVVEAQLNNMVGAIIKYRGEKPSYEVAPCIPQEMYEHLQRLINYAYQQSGISALAAAAQKPQGLNSGEAIRSYDDLQSDRFAALVKRYEDMYIDLSYQITETAMDIQARTGSYSTVYPDKDGIREVDLPKARMLKDTYVIKCHDESALPKDPAGRKATLSEMLASGEITLSEFRRLMRFPDLEQSDRLANALQERIFQALDKIVEDGDFTQPDPFMLDAEDTATKMTVNYINLYSQYKLEEEKMQMLRDFFTQINALKAASQPPQPQQMPQGGAPGQPTDPNAQPQPAPAPTPVSAVSQVA